MRNIRIKQAKQTKQIKQKYFLDLNIKRVSETLTLFLLPFIFSFFLMVPLNALAKAKAETEATVIYNSGQTVSAAPYLADVQVPNSQTKLAIIDMIENHPDKLKKQNNDFNQFLFPASSTFSYGKVKKHALPDSVFKQHAPNIAFYVIGDDDDSIHWAKQNADYLNKIHAIGIITNIKTADRLKAIEKATGLTLIIANIDGLDKTVETTHYPFLVYQNWVVQ